MDDRFSPPQSFAMTAALFEGSLVAVAVALGWLLDQPPLETLQDGWHALAWSLPAVLPPLLLMLACIKCPLGPCKEILRVVDQWLVPLFRQCTALEMAVIALLAGLGEEMLFRGVLQAAIARWLGSPLAGWQTAADWLALAVVAVLFAAAHAVNLSYAVLAGLIGLYLGWLWMATGDLAVPITVHALYDFLALLYLVKVRGL